MCIYLFQQETAPAPTASFSVAHELRDSAPHPRTGDVRRESPANGCSGFQLPQGSCLASSSSLLGARARREEAARALGRSLPPSCHSLEGVWA